MDRESAEACVGELFQLVLKRDPDLDGLETFSTRLMDGSMVERDVLRSLLSSDEFQAHHSASIKLNTLEDPSYIKEMEGIVTDLYEVILKRTPDQEALRVCSEGLITGKLSYTDIVKSLLTSDEFGLISLRHTSVAKLIARSGIAIMTGRDPGEEVINAYAQALSSGYSFAEFLTELGTSPECVFSGSQSNEAPPKQGIVPIGLGLLVEGLIASQMIKRGCKINAIPAASSSETTMSALELGGLIRTLAMLGH